MANQNIGTVKWFNTDKGFGFIQLENSTDEFFVHHSEINSSGYGRSSLSDGQKVSFEIGKNDKGPQAKNVSAI
ncbi:cold-shock protein [Aliarcobacter vitoriensis]|uniref:Cold-shock protein n=1 Tax=Aliarcobacter vitoriensis TaxID=2011099 RepID=A0A366MUA5_9BACT|nr:cold-shock protein [Aliarcobacter vitoriensis]RBQ29200.1 cold-shock protein [Aliarcobacter vitoriensis]RBQ30899.1 cold-shock protein [Arcobacter sp. FW59]